MMSFFSLAVSAVALGVSILAYRRSGQTAQLCTRREAIDHVRVAYGDVILHDHIDSMTVESLREACQLAQLVFNKEVSAKLVRLHGLAFGLESRPFSKRSDREQNDRDSLADGLTTLLGTMKSEAAVNRQL